MKQSSKYKAVTYLEAVIYLAMFAVLFTVMMQFYFNVSSANQRAAGRLAGQRVRIFISEQTKDVVNNAISFNESASTTGIDNSVVRFEYPSSYLEYYLSNGQLFMTDGTLSTPLTPPNVVVSKFRADVYPDSGDLMYLIYLSIELTDPNNSKVIDDFNLLYIKG